MYINTPSSPFPLHLSRQKGISLIELIMFIVIIGIALAGIMLVMNQISGNSSDTLLRKQAQAMAESLLEEIEAQQFADITQASISSAVIHVTSDSGLAGYSASAVSSTSAWSNIPMASAVRITVTVTDPLGHAITTNGYRTDY